MSRMCAGCRIWKVLLHTEKTNLFLQTYRLLVILLPETYSGNSSSATAMTATNKPTGYPCRECGKKGKDLRFGVCFECADKAENARIRKQVEKKRQQEKINKRLKKMKRAKALQTKKKK